MKAKVLEIRDRGTFIPALAVDMIPHDDPDGIQRYYLHDRCGYVCDEIPSIILTRLSGDGTPAWCDPYDWPLNPRTFRVAHEFILTHWAELKDGDVIDVEFILGESAAPKVSERITYPSSP